MRPDERGKPAGMDDESIQSIPLTRSLLNVREMGALLFSLCVYVKIGVVIFFGAINFRCRCWPQEQSSIGQLSLEIGVS